MVIDHRQTFIKIINNVPKDIDNFSHHCVGVGLWTQNKTIFMVSNIIGIVSFIVINVFIVCFAILAFVGCSCCCWSSLYWWWIFCESQLILIHLVSTYEYSLLKDWLLLIGADYAYWWLALLWMDWNYCYICWGIIFSVAFICIHICQRCTFCFELMSKL